MKNIIEVDKKEESEFSESQIEKEYKCMDLNMAKVERKPSFNYQMTNHLLNFREEEEGEIDEDNSLISHSLSQSIMNNYSKMDNNNDILPLSTLIFYSLPSFGKMSCLVLLNVNSTLY